MQVLKQCQFSRLGQLCVLSKGKVLCLLSMEKSKSHLALNYDDVGGDNDNEN